MAGFKLAGGGILFVAFVASFIALSLAHPNIEGFKANKAQRTALQPGVDPTGSGSSTSNDASLVNSSTTNSSSIAVAPIQQVASNCNGSLQQESTCSIVEFSIILQRLNDGGDVLREFKAIEELNSDTSTVEVSKLPKVNATTLASLADRGIRLVCIRELVNIIHNLASNELQLKTILDLASNISPSSNLRPIFRSRSSNNNDENGRSRPALHKPEERNNCSSKTSIASKFSLRQTPVIPIVEGSGSVGTNNLDKSQTTGAWFKLVSTINHWISTLERFTATREWTSLMKIFQGAESILEMFVSPSNSTLAKNQTPPLGRSGKQDVSSIQTDSGSKLEVNANKSDNNEQEKFIEKLKLELPVQVQTLATSLNNLFPWHVWPWNNMDLYSTIDTFLNHGIFAFSQTTKGPDRRIDFLADMLRTLFKSLKYDTFPKKCTDWSTSICDQNDFAERFIAPASDGEVSKPSNKTSRKNQFVQELSCIMFSSLSVQRFNGSKNASEEFLKDTATLDTSMSVQQDPAIAGSGQSSAPQTRLAWDALAQKSLKLYSLSREALTNEQWLSMYNLLQDLWSKEKISDRMIMIGRVLQLLTNCHMPKEMLESALWKDIYKYKNVLNQVLDIVIEELNKSSENGQFTIDQVALGSRHLRQIILSFIKLLPNLIESLSETVVDFLPDLVETFFREKVAFFRAPCKGYSFSDVIVGLRKHQKEIIELEELICRQISIKPNITMMYINNLTNDFLAMAFNLSNFGGTSLNLPKVLTELNQNGSGQSTNLTERSTMTTTTASSPNNSEDSARNDDVSIIDELVANPRLAPIVAILQSSSLDPPEVHAELPELDWVEASTSIAMLYESIQKLMSYEGLLVVFPEVENFQQELDTHIQASKQMFKRFSRRGLLRLTAYFLDTAMPVLLRTSKPLDSFDSECTITPRETLINQEQENEIRSRKWQCFVSSSNFASMAINSVMKNFNSILSKILLQVKSQDVSIKARKNLSRDPNIKTCALFDGSLNLLVENWSHFIDVALETILVAATKTVDHQQSTTYNIVCDANKSLDPFDLRGVELKTRLKQKMCHLYQRETIENCSQVLSLDEWTKTVQELNSTWFETNAISIKPSFGDIVTNIHDFLVIFGQFKPNYLTRSALNKFKFGTITSSLVSTSTELMEKYQGRRFEYGLQTLCPIVHANSLKESAESRDCLIQATLGTKAILAYFKDYESINKTSNLQQQSSSSKITFLFEWLDKYSLVTAEALARTMANNLTKLEGLFESGSQISSIEKNPIKFGWHKFCSASASKFLSLEALSESQVAALNQGQQELCRFNWTQLRADLSSDSANKILEGLSTEQITRIALTKLGQTIDVVASGSSSQSASNVSALPKFLDLEFWQPLTVKIPQISPLRDQPTNFAWIWESFEQLVDKIDTNFNQTNAVVFTRILDQLNCGLDAIKGGLTWDNMAIIYQDKQDVIAAHSTLNNGLVLASMGLNTFFTHKKFQKFLDEFVKPRLGFNAFCEMREPFMLRRIFSLQESEQDQEILQALEVFQEFVCDTNIESLAHNMNPISVCYSLSSNVSTNATSKITGSTSYHPLAEVMDRFFKLSSLAILDLKLSNANDVKPSVFDQTQWKKLWNWPLEITNDGSDANPEPVKPKTGAAALTVVRLFQALDSLNLNHIVWRAIFRSVHELSDLVAYLLRANDQRYHEVNLIGAATKLFPLINTGSNFTSGGKMQANNLTARQQRQQQQQQKWASTLSNVMFPEANNFISFKTFKQARYIKLMTEYFVSNQAAKRAICQSRGNIFQNQESAVKIELIGYRLDSNEKLFTLLCHYHPSQWLTALNIVMSSRTSSITKKVNYMTKCLTLFVRDLKDQAHLDSFMHDRQLENIESVSNTTISYISTTSQTLQSLSLTTSSKNISWHSLPDILDSVDLQLCASKYGSKTFQRPKYEPKKIELDTIICKLPGWNISHIYNYLSENFDLQNMISLLTQRNSSINLQSNFGASPTAPTSVQLAAVTNQNLNQTCATPFKFASRWLKIGQELIDELMSKTSRDKVRKCLKSSAKKGGKQSVFLHSLKFVKFLNGFLSTLNNLSGSDSWNIVKRSWTSISQSLLSQSSP